MGASVLSFTRHRAADEDRPAYDGEPVKSQHITMMCDAVLDAIGADLGAVTLAVYVALERRANASGVCDPSYDTIAASLKLTRRSVIDHVKRLTTAGYLQIRKRNAPNSGNLTNEFYLPQHPNIRLDTPGERAGIINRPLVNDVHPPSERPSEPASPASEHPSELGSPKVDTSIKTVVGTPDGDAPPKNQKPKEPVATRLPDDIDLSDEWRDAALAMGYPERDVEWQFEKFRDYWHSKPGTAAKKTDWYLTWLNWIRTEMGRKGMPITPLSKRSKQPAPAKSVSEQQHDRWTQHLLDEVKRIRRDRGNAQSEWVIEKYDRDLAEVVAQLAERGVALTEVA